MPTYQYVCTACGESLEAVQKFSDEPLTECPACSGRLRKVFSAVGVVFKGSGFYKTDSRSSSSSGASKPAASDKTSEKASDKAGEKASSPAPAAASSSASDGSAA